MRKTTDETLAGLKDAKGRVGPLQVIFMSPAQSTDAWLRWALVDGNGERLEEKSRHTLKRDLYGHPPRNLAEKALVYADALIKRMETCGQWPRSLRDLQFEIEKFKAMLAARTT